MSNMDYCRFRNTLRDFQDCFNTIMEIIEEGEELPEGEERTAMIDLVELCEEICHGYANEIKEKVYDIDYPEDEEDEEEEGNG